MFLELFDVKETSATRRRAISDPQHLGWRFPLAYNRIIQLRANRKGVEAAIAFFDVASHAYYLRTESFGFGLARAVSRRKIVSPSFIRSRRSRAIVSRYVTSVFSQLISRAARASNSFCSSRCAWSASISARAACIFL